MADYYDDEVDGCPECGGQQGYHRDACDTGALDEDLEGGPFWTSRLLGKRERELVRLEGIWPFYCFLACLVGIVLGMGIMSLLAG